MAPEAPSPRPALIDKLMGDGRLTVADVSATEVQQARNSLLATPVLDRQRVIDRISARLDALERDTTDMGGAKTEVQKALKELREATRLLPGLEQTASTANTVTDMSRGVIAPGSTADQRVANAGGLLGLAAGTYLGAKLYMKVSDWLTGHTQKPGFFSTILRWGGAALVGGAILKAGAKPVADWAKDAKPVTAPLKTAQDLGRSAVDTGRSAVESVRSRLP